MLYNMWLQPQCCEMHGTSIYKCDSSWCHLTGQPRHSQFNVHFLYWLFDTSCCVGSLAAFEVDLELWPEEECNEFDVSVVLTWNTRDQHVIGLQLVNKFCIINNVADPGFDIPLSCSDNARNTLCITHIKIMARVFATLHATQLVVVVSLQI